MKTLDLSRNYKTRVPFAVWLLILVFLFLIGATAFSLYRGFISAEYISGAIHPGERGDFWGGHIAAITGSITLLVVIIFSASQALADRKARLRESFLQGIGHIAAYDIESSGCEQALRLLDYFSMIANQLKDPELLLMLNTVMTKKIRETLEDLDARKQEIYPNARAARREIQQILEGHYKSLKGYEEEVQA